MRVFSIAKGFHKLTKGIPSDLSSKGLCASSSAKRGSGILDIVCLLSNSLQIIELCLFVLFKFLHVQVTMLLNPVLVNLYQQGSD